MEGQTNDKFDQEMQCEMEAMKHFVKNTIADGDDEQVLIFL